MMDSQSNGGVLALAFPPRITAHNVIEAHRRHVGNPGYQEGESALELLEKADDVEDLSLDTEIWEEVRMILFEGQRHPPILL